MNFDNFLNEIFNSDFDTIISSNFYSKIDFSENYKIKSNKDNCVLTISLPGYKKEDITIDINSNILEIKSEVKKEGFKKPFKLKFKLNQEILDLDKINAKLEDGILTIIFDNKTPSNIKKIEIN